MQSAYGELSSAEQTAAPGTTPCENESDLKSVSAMAECMAAWAADHDARVAALHEAVSATLALTRITRHRTGPVDSDTDSTAEASSEETKDNED